MPLYEYKCRSCGDVFELIQKFSDEPLTIHEKCGGAVERLMSAPALQFKGSGWYVTDYGKGNSKKPQPDGSNSSAKGEKSNGSSGASESSGKSETSGKADSKSTTESKPASKSDK